MSSAFDAPSMITAAGKGASAASRPTNARRCFRRCRRANTIRVVESTDLASHIRSHRPGHALARDFYTDPAIFEHDMERMLLRHWFCAGHVSSIPRAGDYLVVDLGSESVIIVRNSAGDVRALLNVCRHRGSRLCGGGPGT